MQRDAVNCPRCGTTVTIAAVSFPLRDPSNAEITGTILKECRRCRTWNWMSLQTQEAT